MIFEEKYKASGFGSQRRYPNEGLIRFLAAHYRQANREAVRILELGCGSGANLWMIAREGFDAHGLDIAPTGLELCREMLDLWNVSAALVLGDMTKLPYEACTFDGIVDVVSMQHLNLEGHRKAMMEVMRCLKPGGLFFQYHLGDNSDSYILNDGPLIDPQTVVNISKAQLPLYNNGPTCFLNESAIRDLYADFELVGLETVKRSYSERLFNIEYWEIVARKPVVAY